MRAKARTIAAIAVLISATALPGPTSAGSSASLVVAGADEVLMERLEWALDRFADANLRLPPLDIAFHDGVAACEGYRGLHRLISGTADIEICTTTEHIILHELAHAWDALTVSDATRAEVLRYWGHETWEDRGVDWNERGGEKAADTIAFALNDIPSNPRESLLKYLCGYPLLTGNPLPTPGGEEPFVQCGSRS